MNRPYEVMYILDSRLDEEAQKQINARVNDTIAKIGGKIEKSESLGRKRLAYPIKKRTDGVYMLTHFEGDSRSLKELNRVMNITEGLLRHLVVRRDED
ncbi:MAG: 30S ribosomal protein S6 [Candidatus Sericytochromatia bacterium]|nr:30S ribosomal protein S6 [Candidatus Sericytochromatia bacterium]